MVDTNWYTQNTKWSKLNVTHNQTFWGKLAEVSSRVVLVQLVSVGVAMQLSEHLKHQLNFDIFLNLWKLSLYWSCPILTSWHCWFTFVLQSLSLCIKQSYLCLHHLQGLFHILKPYTFSHSCSLSSLHSIFDPSFTVKISVLLARGFVLVQNHDAASF